MADQQWPSEDEDFDATTSSDGSPVAAHSGPRSVVINDEADQSEAPGAEESSPEYLPEAPQQVEDVAPDNHEQPAPVAKPAKTPKPPKPPKAPRSGSMGRSLLEFVLVAALIGLGLWAWSLKTDNSNLKSQVVQLNNNPQVAVQKQTESLISQVGKLIQLPSGETPTIASVTDASQAKQQSAFFANAQNGDKVLMYVKAGEAVLYRPSTDKIILVAPLTFTNSASTTSTGTTSKK